MIDWLAATAVLALAVCVAGAIGFAVQGSRHPSPKLMMVAGVLIVLAMMVEW